jgi:hypothetical protein
MKMLRQQKGDLVEDWIEQQISSFNSDYSACMSVHTQTPAPSNPIWSRLPQFVEEPPTPPSILSIRFIDRLLLRKRRIEIQNKNRNDEYLNAYKDWNQRAQMYHQVLEDWRQVVRNVTQGAPETMQSVLAYVLKEVPWPRQTEISFDFSADSSAADIDIDLPEIELMPDRTASAAARGIRVNFKDRTPTQIRADYSRLVHGIMFRVAGEAFANLPTVSQVTVSGFTQRHDPSTGHMVDDYIISARIHWADWTQINFTNLSEIDPIEALGRFEIARSAARNGMLERIRPLQ